MIVFWIVTSALLANLYREFCDNLKDDAECNEIDERFTATPVLGFICFVAWVRTLYTLIYGSTQIIQQLANMYFSKSQPNN